jgi:hypothetical protein
VIARRWGDLAGRRRAALDALRGAPDPPTIREVIRALAFAYVGLVDAEGPDAQRWLDLMHALWLDRSPALAFMTQFADQERDWEHLARAALPQLPDGVFAARLALAIETIIVGLRTPSATPGSTRIMLPTALRARAELLVDFVVAGLEGPC